MPWMTDVSMTDVDSSFGDFQLLADLVYRDEYGAEWTVPAGFIGDLSSVPGIVRTIIPKTILGKAPWLHDFLYRTQPPGVTRAHADYLFRAGAIDEGMKPWKAWALWAGLRVGGWMAWKL